MNTYALIAIAAGMVAILGQLLIWTIIFITVYRGERHESVHH